MTVSYRASYQTKVDTSLSSTLQGWPAVHQSYSKKTDRMKLTRMPGATVSQPLDFAIEIGSVHPMHQFVKAFVSWTIEYAEQGLADHENWDKKWKQFKSENMAQLLASMALAKAMRADADVDAATMETSRAYAIRAAEQYKKVWGSTVESDFLRAVQNCLIVGDIAHAREMIGLGYAFVDARKWHAWLSHLISALGNIGDDGCLPDAYAAHFQGFFDFIRDPAFRGGNSTPDCYMTDLSIVRLQLALIKRRYVFRKPLAGGWSEVLLSISE